MAELTTTRTTIYEVVEQGYGGRKVVHGAFSTPQEAEARYRELLSRQPHLATPGVLWVAERQVEVLEEAKMRRPGKDGYEDKARGVYTHSQGGARQLR